MKLAARPTVFAFAVVLALGGCGGRRDGALSAATRAELAPLVQQVRRAAGSRDLQGAQRALVELQHVVASYRDRGNISPARAAQILDAAAQVQHRLVLMSTSTSAIATTTTIALPREHGRGNTKRHGKGNGGDGSGGND